MGRLMAIVLDSAEWRHVEQLMDDGAMPFLAKSRDAAARCRLRTPTPYRAEYSCTEFLTGRSAAANRYWSTVTFEPETYRCVTVGSAPLEPFYALGSSTTVVSFDVPHAILSDAVRGVQVVGWGGHDARFQYTRSSQPAGLVDELDERFGRDPSAEVEFTGSWHQPDYIERLGDTLVDAVGRRAEIARWLLQRVPDWELFLMGLPEVHAAGHTFSHGAAGDHLLSTHPTAALARRRFTDVYRAVDAAIAAVAASMRSDDVLAVLSVKGMEPDRDDLAGPLVAEFLHQRAFGRPYLRPVSLEEWRATGFRPVDPDPGYVASATMRRRRPPERPDWRARLRHITPAPVRRRVRRHMNHSAPPPLAPGPVHGSIDWHVACWYRRAWPKMPAFAIPSFSDAHVRVNLAGRERHGLVAPADYRRFCDELEADLRDASDPRTGRPVVGEVFRPRADDPLAPDGPSADLIVTWQQPADAIDHPHTGLIGPFPFPRSGSHTANGFALLAGAGILPTDLGERAVLDLPPTLLSLLRGEPAEGFEGTPIVVPRRAVASA